jgi:parallel beta-helix repeat protein
VIENNTVVGNTNGIILVPGAERNVIRRNVVAGNPAVQVAVDHVSNSGVDIRNLSGSDTNTFQANVCLTSVNAPCPALGPSLTASPNPILLTGAALYGMTTISWSAPDSQIVDLRIGSPDGKLFATVGNRGSIQTGAWVFDGMTFYLQDVTGGKPLTSENTLATLVVRLQKK